MNTPKRTYAILVAILLLGILFFLDNNQSAEAKDNSKNLNVKTFSPNLVVKNVTQNSKGTAITSCMDIPSSEDWIPEGIIKIGDKVVKPIELSVLDVENKEVFYGTHRCYEFIFSENIDLSGEFIVLKLSTTMPDFISQEECDRVMAAISESDSGLETTCKIGDHGVSFIIDVLPKGLTEIDVSTKIRGAFTKTVEGPWPAEIK